MFFFKVSRNPFPAGSDVTIKTCSFSSTAFLGLNPKPSGRSACVLPLRHQDIGFTAGRICVFIPRAISKMAPTFYRGKSWRQEANLCSFSSYMCGMDEVNFVLISCTKHSTGVRTIRFADSTKPRSDTKSWDSPIVHKITFIEQCIPRNRL